MTTVTNASLANYYSLKDAANSATQQQSAAPSLMAAFASVNGQTLNNANTNGGSSYLLDLSDNARNYLQSISSTAAGQNAAAATSGEAVVLNHAEQTKLAAILAKYKDAPYNDTTFKQIQKDLREAGLGADELAAKSQMRKMNPTAMLIDALSGGDASVGTVGGSANITADATAYLKKVAEQWTQISTTAATTKTTDSSAASA